MNYNIDPGLKNPNPGLHKSRMAVVLEQNNRSNERKYNAEMLSANEKYIPKVKHKDPRVLRLSIYAIVYAFYNDDGDFSFFEKHTLLKLVKKPPYSFGKKQKKELKTFMKKIPTKESIVNFLNFNKLTSNSLVLAYEEIGNEIVQDKRYKKLFDSLLEYVKMLEK